MRIAIALALLALPLLVVWAMIQGLRRGQLPLWKGLVLALAALVLLLGNPLANMVLLRPIDSALQRRLFARAQAAGLLGAPEARVREALGAPWKVRQIDGPFWAMSYAPCRVCMSSYAAPFQVFLESGKVYAFRSGTGEGPGP